MGYVDENWVIDHVPAGVWRTILRMTVTDDFDIEATSTTIWGLQESVWLSHVCKAFRYTTLDLPELWCNITLRVNPIGYSSPMEGLLIVALERSKSLPLTLGLVYDSKFVPTLEMCPIAILPTMHLGPGYPLIYRYILSSFRHLALNFNRAKHMRIDCRALNMTCIDNFDFRADRDKVTEGKLHLWRAISDSFFTRGRGAPVLEKLLISGDPHVPTAPEIESELYVQGLAPFLHRAMNMAPKLQNLIIHRPRAWGEQSLFASNGHPSKDCWKNLVEFEVVDGQVTAIELLHILLEAHSLQRYKPGRLVGCCPDPLPYNSLPLRTKTFLSLRELTLVGSSELDNQMDFDRQRDNHLHSPSLCNVLSFIAATNLTSLVLRRDCCEWNQRQFTGFLHSSGKCLQHLILDRDKSTEKEKLQFLELLPRLKSLEIHSTFSEDVHVKNKFHLLTDVFAKGMSERNRSTQEFKICPQLESFGYDRNAVEVDSDDMAVLSPMIQERWNGALNGHNYLKKVSVCGVERCSPYDIKRLLDLKEEGLEVIFHYKSCLDSFICREVE